jgi:hypothetical protein
MAFNWPAPALKQGPKEDDPRPFRAASPPGHARRDGVGHVRRAAHVIAALLYLACARPVHAADPAGGADSIPLETRDLVQAAISVHLVLPQTARWEFLFMTPYAGGGKLVCGRVNFQSAERRYVGPIRFYAIVASGRVTRSQLQDPPNIDTTGGEERTFDLLCPHT